MVVVLGVWKTERYPGKHKTKSGEDGVTLAISL